MSKGFKNSPKVPAGGPALDIEQIKAAIKSGLKSNGNNGKAHNDSELDDVQLEMRSPAVIKRLNALKNEQVRLTELEARFFEEMHALECKYHKLYEPIYERRRQIVNGEYEPTAEESVWALDCLNGAAAPSAVENGQEAKSEEKGVPNFWLETLQVFRVTGELVQECDEPILAFLQDIQVKMFDQKPYGYTLEFHFAENPFFTNRVLTKTYELKIEVDAKDPFSFEGPDLAKVVGSRIEWRAGKNVCVKLIKKTLKSKNKRAPPKHITKEEKQDSFFNFFDTPKSEKNGAVHQHEDQVAVRKGKSESHDDEDDEEDEDDIFMFADFEIAQTIREKVIPKAVLYFTGELDDEDYEDYDDEDEEGDEDDEEDEDDKKALKGGKKHGGKPAKGPGAKPHAGGAPGGKGGEPTPSECKQN